MKAIIPIPTDLNIEQFTGAHIDRTSSYIENGIIEEYPEGKRYVTQRPSFTEVINANDAGVAAKGRGIYYWRYADNTYYVNDGTVYYDSYSTAVTESALGSFQTGSQRVYFGELGDYLFIVDTEGNRGHYIDGSVTTTTLIEVTAADFPDNSAGFTLAHGCAVLDNTLYVLANQNSDGVAYVCGSGLLDVSNASGWVSTNRVAAYKNPDRGVYIGRHHDNIFVLGNESCEFFYNAGNPSPGTPLGARQDISYNIGCADGKSVFIDNDTVFFVGKSSTAGIGVFKMSNFQIEKISSPSMDSFLTTAMVNNSVSVVGSGLFAGGRTFYVITLHETTGGVIVPAETLVYNTKSNTWTMWEHSSTDINQFPLVGWTQANSVTSTPVTGKGILSNGDIIECYDDFFPQDRTAGFVVFATADTVFVDGVFATTSTTGDQIELKVRVGHIDFDTRQKKFMHWLRPVCDQTDEAQTLYIKYADDNHETFTSERTIDLSNDNDKLTRLGQFRSRTFEIRYAGDELLRLNGLEVEVVGAEV